MPDSPVVAAHPEPDPALADTSTGTDPGPARQRTPGRKRLVLVAVPIVALVVANNVGDALTTTLATTHPLWLIALNSRNRTLALVTNELDAVSYYGVATLRLLVSDPLFFLIGHWYGDAAVAWMERRTRTWGTSLRQLEKWFEKAAYPLVFVAPNNFICLIAGAAGMGVGAFFVVNLAGTLVRLYLIRRLGEAFEAPIDDLLGFLADYRVPLLVISVVLVALTSAFELRRGDSELEAVLHLDDDLEPDDEAGPGAGEGQRATPPAG